MRGSNLRRVRTVHESNEYEAEDQIYAFYALRAA